jgi:hypothetical protein
MSHHTDFKIKTPISHSMVKFIIDTELLLKTNILRLYTMRFIKCVLIVSPNPDISVTT